MSETVLPTNEYVQARQNERCYGELKGAFIVTATGIEIASVNSREVGSQEVCMANARLIANAFNVYHETGLQPVKIRHQRDELYNTLLRLVRELHWVEHNREQVRAIICVTNTAVLERRILEAIELTKSIGLEAQS